MRSGRWQPCPEDVGGNAPTATGMGHRQGRVVMAGRSWAPEWKGLAAPSRAVVSGPSQWRRDLAARAPVQTFAASAAGSRASVRLMEVLSSQ